MPASYPSSAKVFTTKSDGPGNTILAAHVNDLQLEVTAIEQDLIAGLPVSRGGTGLTAALAANRIPYSDGSQFASAAGLTFDGTTFTAPATTITQPLTISGGQIVFPAAQSASTDANTLDDYEEGSFTPTIGGSGGQSGQVYTTQVGRYIKIGKLVMAQFRVTLSTLGTITTNVEVQGLPFAAENTTNNVAICAVNWFNTTSTYVFLSGVVNPNTSVVRMLGAQVAATGVAALVQADLANNTTLDGTIVYRAAA